MASGTVTHHQNDTCDLCFDAVPVPPLQTRTLQPPFTVCSSLDSERERGPRDVHEEAIRKADVLIEALGYIRKFHGRFTVIKLGGSVMEDPEALRALPVDGPAYRRTA